MKYLQTPFITWSRTKQPETTMENTKKTALLKVICQFIISKLTKDLFNIGKNTTVLVATCIYPMRLFNKLENNIPENTFWKDQLAYMKVQAHRSSEVFIFEWGFTVGRGSR